MARLQRNLLHLMSGTLVARLLGFLREMVCAHAFGASRAMDLFVVAMTVPSFFRRVFGEDVVERAFMPPFKSLITREKHAEAWRLLATCLNAMTILSLLVLALLYLLAPLLVRWIAPGLEPELMPQAVKMTWIVLPFMLFIGLASFAGGVLNIFECNRVYALAPAMLSLAVITSVLTLRDKLGIYSLPVGAVTGAFLQMLVQLPTLIRAARKHPEARYHAGLYLRNPQTRSVGRESGFILLKSLVDKSVEVADRVLASWLLAGSISALWFAQRLVQLPLAVFALAISRALTPYLTEKQAEADHERFVSGIRQGILLNVYILAPVAVGALVLGDLLVAIVYERGAFDAHNTRLTALAFSAYALGLPAIGIQALLSRVFAVLQANRTVFHISVGTAALNILLNILLVKTTLAHAGLALASSISFIINAALLILLLNRRVPGAIPAGQALRDMLGGLLLALLPALLVGLLRRSDLALLTPQAGFWPRLLALAILGALFVFAYALMARFCGPRELRKLFPGKRNRNADPR
jgi:putative peptidoglycan lipid II flippase